MIRPEGWRVISARVSEEGYLIPYEATLRTGGQRRLPATLQEMVDPQRYVRRVQPLRYTLLAGGVMDAEALQRYTDYPWERQAAEYPVIPAWLGEHLPLQALFIDNGEIVVYGALDLHIEESADERQRYMLPAGEKWFRYGANGQLLGETRPQAWQTGPSWVTVYFPGFDTALEQLGRGVGTQCEGPVIACTKYEENIAPFTPREEMKPPAILAAFTYRGEPLDLNQPLPAYPPHCFIPLPREILAKIYDAQVRQGLTDPAAVSPWLGRDGGPVIVDPAPQPAKQIAWDWSSPRSECVVIRPLDDPENPYAGKYGDWDRWCFDNIGKENPEHVRQREQQFDELNKKVAEYAKKGERPPAELFENVGQIVIDPEDPWQHFTLNVDAEGFIKPLVDPDPDPDKNPFWGDVERGPFNTNASGVMPPELKQAYDEACWRSRVANYPAVPRWLADAPAYTAIAGPNGEWVTHGELGSWTQFADLEPRKATRAALSLGWYRYSAAGELLGAAPPEALYWPLLYTPGLAELLAAEQAGRQCLVIVDTGFLRVFEQDEDCAESGG